MHGKLLHEKQEKWKIITGFGLLDLNYWKATINSNVLSHDLNELKVTADFQEACSTGGEHNY